MTSRRGPIPGVPAPDPWKPVKWELEEAAAVQAVAHGRASEDQQRRAMKFIVERLCGTFDLSYRPANHDNTVFAEGKRFVGLQLEKFSKLNLARFREKPTEQGGTPKEQP